MPCAHSNPSLSCPPADPCCACTYRFWDGGRSALWEEKLKLRPRFAGNAATMWGTSSEELALQRCVLRATAVAYALKQQRQCSRLLWLGRTQSISHLASSVRDFPNRNSGGASGYAVTCFEPFGVQADLRHLTHLSKLPASPLRAAVQVPADHRAPGAGLSLPCAAR